MSQLRTVQATMKTEDPAGCDYDPVRPHKYILQRIALGTGDCHQTGNNNFSNSNIIIRVIGNCHYRYYQSCAVYVQMLWSCLTL